MIRKLTAVALAAASTLIALVLALGIATPPGNASPTCAANPFTLTNGTTADANQVMSIINNLRTCISNAAANGANSDITSLSGLSTPLTVAQGGTGSAVGPVVPNYLTGYTLSNDVTNPNTTLDIAIGYASDSTNAVAISLGSAITKLIKTQGGTTCVATWVAGSGNCGMVTAAVASHWLFVCAIINAGVADIYFEDITASASNICGKNPPAGTTAFRRIGAVRMDGTPNLLTFTQTYDVFMWAAQSADINAAAPPNTAVTRTLGGTPPALVVEAIVNLGLTTPNVGGNEGVLLSPLSATDVAATATNSTIFDDNSVTATGMNIQARVMTNTVQAVRTRNITGGAGSGVSINTIGYRDFLGR